MNTEISTGSDLNSMAFAEHVAGGAAGGVTYVVKGGRDLRAEIGSPTGIASGADVEALKAGQSTNTLYKATLAELEATPGAYEGQGAFVPLAGTYSWNGAQWVKISDDMLVNKADRIPTRFGIASASRVAEDAMSQVSVIEHPVIQVPHNSAFDPVANRAVYSAAEAALGQMVNAYRFWMRDVPLLGDITLQIYARVQAGSTSAYPPTANDTLLTEVTINGADVADRNDWQYVEFRLPQAITVTGSDLLVWKLSAAGGLSVGRRDDASGVTQFRRGWFGNAGGGSQTINSPNQLAYQAYYRDVFSALAPQVDTLETQAIVVDRSFTREFEAAAAREENDQQYPQDAGHYAWTWGAQAGAGEDVAPVVVIDQLAVRVELASNVASLRLRVWSRPTDPANASIHPASDGNAALLYTGIKTVTELGLVAESGIWQDLRLSFPAIQTTAGQTYLFELWGYTDVLGNVGIGINRATDNGYNQQQRGWYRANSGIPVGGAIAWKLGGDVYRLSSDTAGVGGASLLDAYDVKIVADGLSVMVSGSGSGDGRKAPINASLSVPAAASGTETKEDYSLIYDTDTVFPSIAGAWVGRRHLTGVSAVRSDTGAALALGVDFAYHVNGKVRGLVNGEAYNIDVTYSYKRERYDLIQIDPQTLVVTIKAGSERDFDAIEYQPLPDDGKVSIGYLHVVGGNATTINASQFQGGVVRRGSEADWQQLLIHNRACLRRMLGKVALGQAIRLGVLGDSIVAHQLGDPPYTANGPARDRPENYLINMPADTVAALPKYDFGDGAGQVHVKISAMWPLIAALEQASGQPVEYLNFGRGGTTSANSEHNGLWPARLQPVLDSGAHVLFIHFGMNELGSASTLANIKTIVSLAKAAGMEVVIMSVPRRNAADGAGLAGWNYTNRVLWRAAVEAGAAFAPQHWIVMDEQLGGMGASPDSLGAAALFNHPGPAEFARYGQVLVQAVLG